MPWPPLMLVSTSIVGLSWRPSWSLAVASSRFPRTNCLVRPCCWLPALACGLRPWPLEACYHGWFGLLPPSITSLDLSLSFPSRLSASLSILLSHSRPWPKLLAAKSISSFLYFLLEMSCLLHIRIHKPCLGHHSMKPHNPDIPLKSSAFLYLRRTIEDMLPPTPGCLPRLHIHIYI